MTDILIINDFVSLGKIAGKMMETVLSYKGYRTFFLPTALIANNFSYGKNAISDTTTYLKESLENWKDIGFKFDIVFIGFILSDEQRDIIYDFLTSLDYKATVILDPIMGDEGALYEGVDENTLNIYRSLLDISDIITPNSTEAKFLEIDYDKFKKDNKKYALTSCRQGDDFYVDGFDRDQFKVYFEKLPKRLTGTGDLFDGLLIHYLITTNDFKKACEKSVKVISQIYKKVITSTDDDNINIEKYLDLID